MIVDVQKDAVARTLTIVAEFEAAVERVWELWSDPRRLERWWGPPSYPSRFEHHDLRAGGHAGYVMTGPAGEQSRGWWRVSAVDPPHSLAFTDGFADAAGDPVPGTPVTTARVQLTAVADGRTRMELRFAFESDAHMAELERHGAFAVFPRSVAQMDAILAA